MLTIFILLVGIIFAATLGILIRFLNQTKSSKISVFFLFIIGLFSMLLIMTMISHLSILSSYWTYIVFFLSSLVLAYLITPHIIAIEGKISYTKIRLNEVVIIVVILCYTLIGIFLGTGINIGGVEGRLYFLTSTLMLWVVLSFFPLLYFGFKERV